MVRPMPIFHVHDQSFSLIPPAIGLFVSISLLVALCAKHAEQIPKNHTSKTSETNTPNKLIITISHKMMIKMMKPLVHGKKLGQGPDTGTAGKGKEENALWQKAILMDEKCQPLDYSGVIYYDYSGNRIPEMPVSPRASPMISPLRNYTFPVDKRDDKSMH